ncbi:YggS family pyridoxal phosphate-dependent enzyme [Pararcticibacter amylolyticus]|uniref:Pyridoxal phosphate homeostasis protein n=1 Tax=Pararcticibacter amylolyticus TaxID=2173175 RepID=A0A2U2PJ76_9SPHI|nr:YggS family pyridoxal phosphate-dependent enzyme [Pararcticibacter amylolyticus]PWG81456.1 YggS family pyridoxal phosphate-dependent enzyme [Pararcticibacter amylolyticus]
MEDPIINNLNNIQRRIKEACARSKRPPEDVRLLLATKTVPAERIKIALQSGCTLIGENKVQEVREKFASLKDIPHQNHFIGHLQSNKIKELLRYDISCIHSLDRLDIAGKLNQRLLQESKTMEVLIQVNTSGEESKFGVFPEDAVKLAQQLSELKALRVRGLMTIGLFSADQEKVRQCFRLLQFVRQEIMNQHITGVEMKELSMGMSGDLETAIEEGATIVRIGTDIFGKRIYPDSYYWSENKV